MCNTCLIEGWASEETTPTAYIAQLTPEETATLEHAEAVLRTAPKATWNDDGTVHWYASPLHVQIDDGNYDMDAHEHERIWVEEGTRGVLRIGKDVNGALIPEPELTIVRTWNQLTGIQRLYLCTKLDGLLNTIDGQVTETIERWEHDEAEEARLAELGELTPPRGCHDIECPPFQEVSLNVRLGETHV